MKKYDLYLKGYVGDEDFDLGYVEYVLEKNPEKEVTVLINSLGGRTDTGISIAAAFARHGNVSVHFSGMSASAATIASMGAKHISIDRGAAYLIHKAGNEILLWDRMNSDDMSEFIARLEKSKANLDKIDYSVASMYAARCKKTPDELLQLMGEETWLTAEETVEWGLVDEVTELVDDAPAQVTKSLVADLESAGIPVPDRNKFPTESRSFLEEFRNRCDRFASFLSKFKSERKMAKIKFPKICSLLGIEELELEQNASVVVPASHLAMIENRLPDAAPETGTSEAGAAVETTETPVSESSAEVPEAESPSESSETPATVTVMETSRKSKPATDSWEQRYAQSLKGAEDLMSILG